MKPRQYGKVKWASYDANGNMTNDGLNAMTYNAENRTVTSSGAEYVYDGAGIRVRRCLPNCTSPTSRTVYVFSGSKVIAEYENGAAVGSPTREYVYLGGQLLAKFEGGTTTYVHHDHLSARVMTNPSGSIVAQSAHFPFGESWYESGGSNKRKFTSYERDSESGNDYAMFRYHINRFGRFSSPDPLSGSASTPQSLNKYAYALNEPTLLTDPMGLAAMQNPCSTGYEAACSASGAEEPVYYLDGVQITQREAIARLQMGSAAVCPEKSGCKSLTGNKLETNATGYSIRGFAKMSCDLKGNCTLTSLIYVISIGPVNYTTSPSTLPSPNPRQPADDGSDPGSVKEFAKNVAWSGSASVGFLVGTAAYHPASGTVCVGGGLGYGFTLLPTIPVSAQAGPLVLGNLRDAPAVLGGPSIGAGFQTATGTGVQGVVNPSGKLAGPTVGTPGASVSLTYSVCW